MFSIRAECQAEEIRLLGVAAEAIIRKIAERVGFEIQNGKGLLLAGGVRTVATVKQHRETAIGRDSCSGREIIDAARIARDIAKKFGVRHLLEQMCSRILRSQRSYADEQDCQGI